MAESATGRVDRVVSFDSDDLILVDEQDRPIGRRSKAACHDGGGVLHRAFSLFIFNPAGQLLVQQRSASKRLWPLYWSNSCCSHPRWGESMEEAIQRRLAEELRLATELDFLFKFRYQASFGDIGAEHELCWVYAGRSSDPVTANRNEIAAWRYVDAAKLDDEIRDEPERFTPWFKMEWSRLREQFPQYLQAI